MVFRGRAFQVGRRGVGRVIRIAGAGLAGLFAALRLAEEGQQVEVLEFKNRITPSSGPHTEAVRNYLDGDALQELGRYGFELEPSGAIDTTIRRSPHYENVLRGRAYYLFLRGQESQTVDQELYRRCVEAGVSFTLRARWEPGISIDILATGPPAEHCNISGAGFTFSSKGSSLDEHTAYALLDNDFAPGGYFVVTPGIDYHSLYSVSWQEFDYRRLLQMVVACVKQSFVREILGSSRRISSIRGKAYCAPNPVLTADLGGILRIGEAGGFQDAIAGFGFRYAILTAATAVDAILSGKSYVALLRNAFKDEFEAADRIRQKLNRFTNDDFDRLVESMGPSMTIADYRNHRASRFL